MPSSQCWWAAFCDDVTALLLTVYVQLLANQSQFSVGQTQHAAILMCVHSKKRSVTNLYHAYDLEPS